MNSFKQNEFMMNKHRSSKISVPENDEHQQGVLRHDVSEGTIDKAIYKGSR